MLLRLAIIVISNPINFINAHLNFTPARNNAHRHTKQAVEFKHLADQASRVNEEGMQIEIRGCAEKFIGWLWCIGRIWPRCGLFFNIVSPAVRPRTSSIGVAALWFPWYRSSHPDLRKSPQLQIQYDLIIGQYCFPAKCFLLFMLRNIIVRWCQIRRIWRMITRSKPQSRTASIATTDLYVGALSSSVFQAVRELSLSSATFQSPE